VLYTLRANHTGSYVKRDGGSPRQVVRQFTFAFDGGSDEAWLIEHIVQAGNGPLTEEHRVRFSGKHLIDRGVGYWRDRQYMASSMQEMLDCTR
jgi:hypothetical protein